MRALRANVSKNIESNYNQSDNLRDFEEITNTVDTINTTIIDNNNNDLKVDSNKKTESLTKENKQKMTSNNEVFVDICRPALSHHVCLICKKDESYQKLKLISQYAIIVAFCDTRILIPFGARACSSHFDSMFNLKNEALNNMKVYKTNSKLNAQQIEDLLSGLRSYAMTNSVFKKFSDLNSISDEMCVRNTNFNRSQFIEILDSITTMRNSIVRTKSQALAIYLFWLKTGLDQN